MKKLLPFLALTFFAACTEKPSSGSSLSETESTNILENLTFSIDTLMVDTGDDFINFAPIFSTSSSPDGHYFYLIDKDLKLQKIDLDAMKIISSFSFEKDGPNRLVHSINFQAIGDGYFYFPLSPPYPQIFDANGNKIKRFKMDLDKIVEGYPIDGRSLIIRIIPDPKRGGLYSMPMNNEYNTHFLAVIDSLGGRTNLLELSEFKKANKFEIRGKGLKSMEQVSIQYFNDLVLISCTVGNAIYVYDLRLDSLSYREFPHELVPLEKTGEVKSFVGSKSEFDEEIKKRATKISYRNFIWDEKSQRYFRFASRALSVPIEGEKAEMEIFLCAYSKDLKLIGETRLEGLSNVPRMPFFKDGKLYSDVNVEDELGFEIFRFNF
ncbi:protein of unknown function [Algoriphagus locisalis]|uniref:TolB-like 6-blade propeller-like n=1 Tax=Algoriphagus locisalis TaxID=305507 RepID=A0A1I7ANJ7_9BACT|nr:DUF4221 family protein [Algoriphagus locisalis]SFT76512.1 protein of unknown function [Algoriphagus locisalis]